MNPSPLLARIFCQLRGFRHLPHPYLSIPDPGVILVGMVFFCICIFITDVFFGALVSALPSPVLPVET